MDLNNPNEPVLVVTDKDGKLVHVGHPETFKKKLLGEYALQGYNTKTITITEYLATKWSWHWEQKPNQ